jgi:hypothetical protein
MFTDSVVASTKITTRARIEISSADTSVLLDVGAEGRGSGLVAHWVSGLVGQWVSG